MPRKPIGNRAMSAAERQRRRRQRLREQGDERPEAFCDRHDIGAGRLDAQQIVELLRTASVEARNYAIRDQPENAHERLQSAVGYLIGRLDT